MRELLIATRNQKKMPGLLAALGKVPFKVMSLADTDLPRDFCAEEPGSTYEAHAAIKAFTYGKHANMLTLADDSGLEVDALAGWPGVHSATWKDGSDADRLEGLLERMSDIPEDKRTARYRSVVALYDPVNDKVRFAEGVCKGKILTAPIGDNAFGYNRIFFSTDLSESFGTASFEDQVRVSHRTRSVQKAREILINEFV
jgi:XTP/dITP diphosphohydrolase